MLSARRQPRWPASGRSMCARALASSAASAPRAAVPVPSSSSRSRTPVSPGPRQAARRQGRGADRGRACRSSCARTARGAKREGTAQARARHARRGRWGRVRAPAMSAAQSWRWPSRAASRCASSAATTAGCRYTRTLLSSPAPSVRSHAAVTPVPALRQARHRPHEAAARRRQWGAPLPSSSA